jgi:putative transposase
MSKSFSCLYYHWVFATKLRRRLIREEMDDPLHAYVGGILRKLRGSLIKAGGVEDHRHMAVRLPPAVAVSEVINKVKSGSTGCLRAKGNRLFGWQNGYAAFSVSPSGLPALIDYISNQRAHHRRVGFREELLRLFEKHGLEPDEAELERFCRRE